MSRVSIVNIESGRHGTTAEKIYIIACIFSTSISDFYPPLKEIEYEIVTEMVEVKRMKAIKKAILKPGPAPETGE